MMSNEQALMGAIAVIVVCLIFAVRSLLIYKGKLDLVGKFDHYKPFAIIAAKWVEKNVPDDYGKGQEDPKTARALHKLDVFLKKFIDMTEKATGVKPTEELKKEAMKWSAELAERVTK